MKVSVKVSKKTGISLFITVAVLMAAIIIFHENPGPEADPQQELAKKIISCVVIVAYGASQRSSILLYLISEFG